MMILSGITVIVTFVFLLSLLLAMLIGMGTFLFFEGPLRIKLYSIGVSAIALVLVVGIFGIIAQDCQIYEQQESLVALKDRPVEEGQIFGAAFLGTGFMMGSWGEKWYYTFYIDTPTGIQFRKLQIEGNKVFVHESSSRSPVLLTTKEIPIQRHWWQFKPNCSWQAQYDFYIPSNSIRRDIILDLE